MVKTLKLSDGRYLAYDEYGDPDGTPVIFNHGRADSRLIRHPDEAVTAALGVRVIAADQPGVGGSSPHPDRTMVDWAKDVEELANALGLGTVNVAGHSGGAPHALAIPYRLADRVGTIALASPLVPLEMTAALEDWGFTPEDIHQHVELFYGDADEILSPEVPVHLSARLADCTTHVWSGAGHYAFVDRERWNEFLGAVA